MKKKIVTGALALIALIVVGIVLISSNIDGLVKKGIETYGSDMTKTKVTLDNASIKISSGKGSLQGFVMGNPEGFKTNHAMAFSKIDVEIDVASLPHESKPVLIKNISIDNPEITYEVSQDGQGNLNKIMDNLGVYKQHPTEAKSEENGRKIIIEKFIIKDGKVKLSHPAFGSEPIMLPLPTIVLSNLGEGDGGLSSVEAFSLVLNKIIAKAIQVGQKKIFQELKDKALSNIKGAAEKSGAKSLIEGFFGK